MRKRSLLSSCMLLSLWAFPQVGINTTTPQKTLHVNGSLQITNELNVGGNASTAGSAGIAGQVLKSNGSGQAPSWQKILQAPNSVGTLIAVNGQLFVAQEITVQLSADYNSGNSTTMIGNLTTEIIDNENKYIADATTNSFQVVADGTYQIIMNMQLSATKGNLPVIGVWDNQDNQWVARVNDTYSATNGTLQTYTLITSIDMLAGRNYSFRSSNTTNYTIRKGGSGAFPLSQISVKRVK